MGQSEILQFLDEEYCKNPNKWWPIAEIKEKLQEKHKCFGNVWQQVNKLVSRESIETKLVRLDNCRWGYKRVVQAKQE